VGTRAIEHKLPVLTSRLVAARRSGQSLDTAVINDRDIAELGRFVVTLDPADIGAFRTPSLRNVALTAPYMHDGSVKTLEEAVDIEIYYRGVDRGYPLIVTLQERADLVEFLKALTTPQMTR
jgi:cytochrome c peroxidase